MLHFPNVNTSGVAQWLACWAHNPKVRGSKPRSANLFSFICLLNAMRQKMDTLGIEPRASRMLSRCDTTTPRALCKQATRFSSKQLLRGKLALINGTCQHRLVMQSSPPHEATGVWRNGSASDSRSEGWEFESLCPHFANTGELLSWCANHFCI